MQSSSVSSATGSSLATHWNNAFAVGFRPFFFAGAWMAALWMALWLAFLAGLFPLPAAAAMSPITWHAHEMLFGFAGAVIAGFVLTASQNWTGERTTTPATLTALFAVWLAARIGFLIPQHVPLAALTVLDLLFFPLVAVALGRVLWLTGNRRNYMFIPLLAALTLLNGLVHAELHGWSGWAQPALQATVGLLAFLLVFMGGRVIPFFTERRLPWLRVRRWRWLDWASTLSVLAVPALWLVTREPTATAAVMLLAAVLTAARALGWSPWGTWRVPLLWILHLGYLWIPIGLAVYAAHLLGADLTASAGQHALMVGAMGALTLGMMARVALGHSGRALEVPRPVTVGFVLMLLAGIARLGAEFLPVWGNALLMVSGVGWIAAFLLYAVVYTPILLQPPLKP